MPVSRTVLSSDPLETRTVRTVVGAAWPDGFPPGESDRACHTRSDPIASATGAADQSVRFLFFPVSWDCIATFQTEPFPHFGGMNALRQSLKTILPHKRLFRL